MFAVEMRGLGESDEELRPVSVTASIGHGEKVLLSVTEFEVLISELLSIDTLTTCSISFSEVSSLCHEARDNSVEETIGKVELLEAMFASTSGHAALTSA
jgi:hypothetical protein